MNPTANTTAAKVYEVHSETLSLHVALHLDGRRVIDLETGETLVKEGEIAKKEFQVLWFLLSESQKKRGRTFTTQEIFEGGWPEYKNLPADHKRVKGGPGNVSKTMSNLRGLLPSVMLVGAYGIKGEVFDKTPPESLFLLWHRIFVASSIAVATTVGIDSFARAILATFGWTIVQSKEMGFALGLLQGIIGSLVWSVVITVPLLFQWFIVEKFGPLETRMGWVRGIAVGTVAGIVGGVVVSIACLKGQFFQSRVDTGWLLHAKDSVWTAFTVTRVAYSGPWFGAVIGFTVALTLLWIVSRRQWADFLDKHTKLTQLSEFWGVVWALGAIALRWGMVFIMPAMLLAAAAFWWFLPRPLNAEFPMRIFGEAVCIGIGGISLVGGVLIGLYSLTKGVDVAGDRKCSLARLDQSPPSLT